MGRCGDSLLRKAVSVSHCTVEVDSRLKMRVHGMLGNFFCKQEWPFDSSGMFRKGQSPLHQIPHSFPVKIHNKSVTVGTGKSLLCASFTKFFLATWRTILTCQEQDGLSCRYQVCNKVSTGWQVPLLLGSYRETCLMDFGHC